MVRNNRKEIGMKPKTNKLDKIREEIFSKIKEYYELKNHERFIPGKERIFYAGAIFDEKEVNSVIDSLLKGWFGLGPKAREFNKLFSNYLGVFKIQDLPQIYLHSLLSVPRE